MRRVPAFFDCSTDTIRALAHAAVTRTAKKGERIFSPEQDWPFIGIVNSGILGCFSADARGRERLFFLAQPFELFGVVPFFQRQFVNSSMTVLSDDATFLVLEHQAVRLVAQDRPELLYSLGVVCAQRAGSLATALQSQTFRPVLDRVAESLLPYATEGPGLRACNPTLARMTQAHIASAAGTVKEVVARAIAELENNGALRRERGHICELNRTRLLELIHA